jgi:CDP-diacylglycerol--glycerol-3-phosphate 3-phosphatidyltransferase
VAEIKKYSLEQHLRKLFKGVLDSVANALNRIGITPNMVTLTGFLGNLAAGVLIAFGELTWGGIIALIVGPLDAVDGALARLRNESKPYGSFVDSVTDRYDELLLLGGLIIHFSLTQDWLGGILVYFAAMGSILVSYIRAKADALGFDAKVGIMTRVERYIVLIPGLILGKPYILIALGIIAVLGNFTAIQRFIHVRKQARSVVIKEINEK